MSIKNLFVSVISFCIFSSIAFAGDASDIIKKSGFRGGLIVLYGVKDGRLAVELSANGKYLVHSLAQKEGNVEISRKYIDSKGLSGKLAVATYNGKQLPYVDNSVNLFVTDNLDGDSKDEVMRVLAPNGVLCVGTAGNYSITKKPWPSDIDQWSHYMRAPDNNAVSDDDRIAPPKHLQWTGGPRWARHHDSVASMNAMVTVNGKLFYVMDEGSTASPLYPSRWKLVARDAFNGVVLWKKDLPNWIPHLWPLKAGPANLPRRLVADGDEVYAPIGFYAPVSVIDANSGKTLRSFPGSENVEELIVSGDYLYTVITTKPLKQVPDAGEMKEAEEAKLGDKETRTTKPPMVKYFWKMAQSASYWFGTPRILKVYNRKTGKLVWEKESRLMPLSLAVSDGKVVYHDGEKVVVLDHASGNELFSTEPVAVAEKNMMSFFAPTLVIKDGVIVFAGGENIGRAWMGWERKDLNQKTV